MRYILLLFMGFTSLYSQTKVVPVNDTIKAYGEYVWYNVFKNDPPATPGTKRIVTRWLYGGKVMDTGKKYFIDTIGIIRLYGNGEFFVHRTEVNIRATVKFPEIIYTLNNGLSGAGKTAKVFYTIMPDTFITITAPEAYMFKKHVSSGKVHLVYDHYIFGVTFGTSTEGCVTLYWAYMPNLPFPLKKWLFLTKEKYYELQQ